MKVRSERDERRERPRRGTTPPAKGQRWREDRDRSGPFGPRVGHRSPSMQGKGKR